ncbi:L,D-transpeptidase family protein [Legionella londiniensis]|uniref:Legionella secretion system protein A n=1 Tax=Legionella londiniensis TaxID=45068 RepID=A0A0W0VNN6_9GAMM|nr:L,D-transpeptidase family protein [Legionella londiniensis]KTD21732.1 Legionella secretion system protein A [Legionella londiniensis]STX93431.1 Legionella secretion system protein A [Legionella londiniensis]
MRYLLLSIFLLQFHAVLAMAPKINLDRAIDNAIKRYALHEEPALKKKFNQRGVSYPPQEIALLAFKKERHIQLWARNTNKPWRHIHTYPLTAFSGRLGPKLKEHDLQIPEGIYRLTTFNPFSAHHLSMMINYPNHFDRLQASKDGRRNLGGEIFLHGKSTSVGCLAVGDTAINQLFLLVRRVGLNHVRVIIAPNDLRLNKPATSMFAQPRWLPELYKNIAQALKPFPVKKQIT